MVFKYTKPRDEQASFLTECHRCNGELTISNGRVDRHDCEPARPIYAERAEVTEWQKIRREILNRLDEEMNH